MTAYKHNTFQIRLRCALRPVFCALLLIVVIVGSLFASFELQAFESRFFGSKDYQGQQPDSSHTMIKNQTVKSELMLLELQKWRWKYRILLLDVSTLDDAQSVVADIAKLIAEQGSEIAERKLHILVLNTREPDEPDKPYENKQVMHLTSQIFKQASKQALLQYSFEPSEIKARLGSKASVLIGLDGGSKSFYDWPSEERSIALNDVFPLFF